MSEKIDYKSLWIKILIGAVERGEVVFDKNWKPISVVSKEQTSQDNGGVRTQ